MHPRQTLKEHNLVGQCSGKSWSALVISHKQIWHVSIISWNNIVLVTFLDNSQIVNVRLIGWRGERAIAIVTVVVVVLFPLELESGENPAVHLPRFPEFPQQHNVLCVVFSLRLLVSETIFNFTRSWRGSRIAFDYPSLPLRLKLCKPEKHTLWPKTTQTCRKFIPLKRHSLYGKGRCCCSLDKTRCEPLVKLLFTS